MNSAVSGDTRAALKVVEVAHAETDDLHDWVTQLSESFGALFPRGVANTAMVIEGGDAGERVVDAVIPSVVMPIMPHMQEQIPRMFEIYGQSNHVTVQSQEAVENPSHVPELAPTYLEAVGARDSLLVCAVADRTVLMVNVANQDVVRLSGEQRRLLTRLVLHMETGLRLRVHNHADLLILRPDGKLLHKSPATPAGGLVDTFTRHVREVERVRTRRARQVPDPVAVWTALVDGRFALSERTDTDGSRHYALIEVERRPLAALSQLETAVVEQAARGLSNKLVSYSLGLTEAQVSVALAQAALKVGCRSRRELVRVAALLMAPPRPKEPSAALTEAEGSVLELVRLGRTNQEIASQRGTSVRTVANQVAAVLRKLGVASRRELNLLY